MPSKSPSMLSMTSPTVAPVAVSRRMRRPETETRTREPSRLSARVPLSWLVEGVNKGTVGSLVAATRNEPVA